MVKNDPQDSLPNPILWLNTLQVSQPLLHSSLELLLWQFESFFCWCKREKALIYTTREMDVLSEFLRIVLDIRL